MNTLEVLNGSGHLSLNWDPDKPDEVEQARSEVEQLRKAGYSFFLVGGQAAGVDDATGGTLLIRRIDDPIQPPEPEPPKSSRSKPPDHRRGARMVATRPMQGG